MYLFYSLGTIMGAAEIILSIAEKAIMTVVPIHSTHARNILQVI
jgi:hypothetical protein